MSTTILHYKVQTVTQTESSVALTLAQGTWGRWEPVTNRVGVDVPEMDWVESDPNDPKAEFTTDFHGGPRTELRFASSWSTYSPGDVLAVTVGTVETEEHE